jgi:hypothetical protein
MLLLKHEKMLGKQAETLKMCRELCKREGTEEMLLMLFKASVLAGTYLASAAANYHFILNF